MPVVDYRRRASLSTAGSFRKLLSALLVRSASFSQHRRLVSHPISPMGTICPFSTLYPKTLVAASSPVASHLNCLLRPAAS